MKKLSILIVSLFLLGPVVFAAENSAEMTETNNIVTDKATQIIEMEDNKINVIVMKQPLNEKSNQKIMLKRNWLGVYIQVNGKVKVNPLTSTYEVQ
mgnify:CR=1 FL=1